MAFQMAWVEYFHWMKCTRVGNPNSLKKIIVAGYFDKERNKLVFIRGDLNTVVEIPLSFFTPSGDGTKADPERLKIIDYGHTVQLGDYEADSEAVLSCASVV